MSKTSITNKETQQVPIAEEILTRSEKTSEKNLQYPCG